MTIALAVAALTGVGVLLVVRGGAVRLIVGFVLLGHAANLMLIAAGGTDRRQAPLAGEDLDPATAADPLPQAFVLTAIVITFGLTVYLLWLAPRADPPPSEDVHDPAGGAS
jgi:multicomponent Na+:H+ antiporter subunit C